MTILGLFLVDLTEGAMFALVILLSGMVGLLAAHLRLPQGRARPPAGPALPRARTVRRRR
jgi:hypothetical protein